MSRSRQTTVRLVLSTTYRRKPSGNMPVRPGTTTNHSWGDSITNDANYNNDIGETTSVGQYAANPWGFFDMHGNVWEWTKDAFVSYTSDSRIDPFNRGWQDPHTSLAWWFDLKNGCILVVCFPAFIIRLVPDFTI